MKLSKNAKALLIAVEKGYKISKDGQVTGLRGDILKGSINNRGYLTFGMRDYEGNCHHICFHRLQSYTKYGNLIFHKGTHSRHKNNNSLDNSWDNILIGDASMNMMDKPKEQRIAMAKYAASFLKKYDNKAIREFHKIDRSYKKTMAEFNISSKGTLNYILNGKRLGKKQ